MRLKAGPALRARESQSDLVQSVCREALEDLSRIECADEDAFRGWLMQVALHKILGRANYHRAQRRDPGREAKGGAPSVLEAYAGFCTPSRDAMVEEETRRIEAAFDRLPENYRDVILASCIEGRSHRELAERWGKSEEALRQLLTRARARLGMLLGEGE